MYKKQQNPGDNHARMNSSQYWSDHHQKFGEEKCWSVDDTYAKSKRNERSRLRAERYREEKNKQKQLLLQEQNQFFLQNEKQQNRHVYISKQRPDLVGNLQPIEEQSKPRQIKNSTSEKEILEDLVPKDEILYDIGISCLSSPIINVYQQNFDFSGYLDVIEVTYKVLQYIDWRFERKIPYSVFLHAMNNLLIATVHDVVFGKGEHKVQECSERFINVFPDQFYIPGSISDYLSGISEIITASSDVVYVNLPSTVIPMNNYTDKYGNLIQSGTFGPVTDKDHNKYEAYICPYTTMTRVIESAADNPDPNWQPLPAPLIPIGGTVTCDFLGWGHLDSLDPSEKNIIKEYDFESGATPGGRMRYSDKLFCDVSDKLEGLRDKFKMREINKGKGIKKNESFANTIYCEGVGEYDPLETRLSLQRVNLLSHFKFSSKRGTQALINVYHRYRTEIQPGVCFMFDGKADPTWVSTRNTNFKMSGDFYPTRGVNSKFLTEGRNIWSSPCGTREDYLFNFININFKL